MRKFLLAIILIGLCFYIRMIPNYDLTIAGGADPRDGISNQGLELGEMLDNELKINFYIHKYKWRRILDIPANLRWDILARSSKPAPIVIWESSLGFKISKYSRVGLFDKFQHFLESIKIIPVTKRNNQIWIAYSMFESDKIPEKYVHDINKYFDAVAVPDKFLVEVYKNSGVTKPVFVLPLHINLGDFLDKPLKSERNKLFTYTNLSGLWIRKNHVKLVEAFAIVQKLRPNIKLVINSRGSEGKKILEDFKTFLAKSNLKNIEFKANSSLSRSDYVSLLAESDCYVSPSKGEGFSIIPRQAMAMGIPTIVTNNTGQSTICDSGLAKCVDSNISQPAIYKWDKEYEVFGNNFDCTVEDLAKAMLDVYDNYQFWLNKGEDMRKWSKQYNLEDIKPLYVNFFKPKKILLGNQNIINKEFLMTDSLDLYEKYLKLKASK